MSEMCNRKGKDCIVHEKTGGNNALVSELLL